MNVSRLRPTPAVAGQRRGAARHGLSKLIRDPLRLALLASIILGVARIHEHFRIIGMLRPALLLFLFCIGYSLLVPSSVRWKLIGKTWSSRAVMLLAVLACASAVFGLSLGGSAVFIINIYSRTLLIFALLVAATWSLDDVRLWVGAYVGSALILVWLAFFVMDTFVTQGQSMVRIQSQYMYDGNDLGVILVAAVPLAFLTFQTAGTWGKAMAIPVIVGVPVAVAMTGSRGSFVGLVVLAVSLLVLVSHVALWKRLTTIAVLAGTLVVAAPAGYWSYMETILHPEEDYNTTDIRGRKAIWTRGLTYIAQYPVFGVGVNNFTRAEETISPLARNAPTGFNVPILAPHNTFLQVMAEMGIPAFLIWVSLFWVGIVELTRIRMRLPRHWARGSPDERFLYLSTVYLPCTFLVVAATTFFVSHLYIPALYILFGILGGVLLEVRRRLPGVAGRRGRRRVRAVAPGRVAV
jgi:O-antigen ligase